MTIANTTSNSLASLLSSTLNSVNGSNGNSTSGSSSLNGSPISTGPIDVNTLVSELMTVESQPMNRLKAQESGVSSKLSAYGQVQSALSSLDTALANLKLGSAFTAAQATVTGSGVGATVSGAAAPGSYSVTVSSIAQAQAAASTPLANASTVVGPGTLTIQLGTYNAGANSFTPATGSTAVNITIDSTNDTLGGIASAINGAAAGVTASVVTDNLGSRLVLTSSNTGASNGFSMTVADADGNNTDTSGLSQLAFDPTAAANAGKNLAPTQTAQDAQFSVNGLGLTSSSNVVTTAISGLTLNLNQAPPTGSTLQSQITVATDSTSVAGSVNSFVQAFNSVVTLEHSLTSYNSTTNTASVLTGDVAAGGVVSQISNIVSGQLGGGAAGYSWLANVGIDFNRDGTLTLDSTKFSNAMSANPSAVKNMFSAVAGSGTSGGFATQMNDALTSMLGPNGTLTAAQNSKQSVIKTMNTRLSQMQANLNLEQTQLITQYSQLNADLVTAQQQQVALANALAGIVPA